MLKRESYENYPFDCGGHFMIIPLNKLLTFNENKYIFTRASMVLVEKIGNIKDYPEDDTKWKVVPNILKLMLDETIKYVHSYENQEEFSRNRE